MIKGFQVRIEWLVCLTVVASFLWSDRAMAQSLLEYQNQFPGFSEIILSQKKKVMISMEDAHPVVYQDHYFESMILNEKGIHLDSEDFLYSDLVQLLEFDAWTISGDSHKSKKIRVTKVDEVSAQGDNIFSDDVKRKKLTYAGLHAGARKVYSYSSKLVDPHLLNQFAFGSYVPTQEEVYEVEVGKGIHIGYHVLNDPEGNIVFQKEEKRGSTKYTWTYQKVPAMVFERNSPGYLHYAPHVILYIREFYHAGQKTEVLGSTDLLYQYYKNFVDNLNRVHDPKLEAFTRELVKDLDTDRDRVKAIFYWIMDNVKYIAFESGYEGFIPREASIVFERRFGDCKDFSSLLSAMASCVDIPNVHICWIGTRKIPYSYKENATPSVDNHMIVMMQDGDESVFLDCTDYYTAFGLPSAFIQGKEALIYQEDEYQVIKVPVVSSSVNQLIETVDLTLDDGLLKGNAEVSFSGLLRSQTLRQLDATSKAVRFDHVKQLLEKGNDKFHLIEFKEENENDRDKPLIISYSFQLDKHTVSTASEDYLSLFLIRPFLEAQIEPARSSPFDLELLVSQMFTIRFEIPEGSSLVNLPSDQSDVNDLLSYDIKYRVEENAVYLTFSIQNHKILLERSDFKLWNEVLKNLRGAYAEAITLKKH